MSATFTIEAAGATDSGPSRSENQDAFLIDAELGLFAVADGIGGHAGGEVAAQLALDTLASYVRSEGTDEPAPARLIAALTRADRAIRSQQHDKPALSKMGCTIVVALHEGPRLHLANAGDARAYLVRDGALRQVSTDHTVAATLHRHGHISDTQMQVHHMRHILQSALGGSEHPEFAAVTLELQPGDRLLLCSDGLNGALDDEQLQQHLNQGDTPEQQTHALLAAALAAKARDNITAVALLIDRQD